MFGYRPFITTVINKKPYISFDLWFINPNYSGDFEYSEQAFLENKSTSNNVNCNPYLIEIKFDNNNLVVNCSGIDFKLMVKPKVLYNIPINNFIHDMMLNEGPVYKKMIATYINKTHKQKYPTPLTIFLNKDKYKKLNYFKNKKIKGCDFYYFINDNPNIEITTKNKDVKNIINKLMVDLVDYGIKKKSLYSNYPDATKQQIHDDFYIFIGDIIQKINIKDKSVEIEIKLKKKSTETLDIFKVSSCGMSEQKIKSFKFKIGSGKKKSGITPVKPSLLYLLNNGFNINNIFTNSSTNNNTMVRNLPSATSDRFIDNGTIESKVSEVSSVLNESLPIISSSKLKEIEKTDLHSQIRNNSLKNRKENRFNNSFLGKPKNKNKNLSGIELTPQFSIKKSQILTEYGSIVKLFRELKKLNNQKPKEIKLQKIRKNTIDKLTKELKEKVNEYNKLLKEPIKLNENSKKNIKKRKKSIQILKNKIRNKNFYKDITKGGSISFSQYSRHFTALYKENPGKAKRQLRKLIKELEKNS